MNTVESAEVSPEIEEAKANGGIPPVAPWPDPPAAADPADVKIEKSPPGTLKEGMAVAIMWRTTDGRTMIYPAMFKVKGLFKGGRLALKVIKNT